MGQVWMGRRWQNHFCQEDNATPTLLGDRNFVRHLWLWCTLLTELNFSSIFLHHSVAQESGEFTPKIMTIVWRPTLTGASNNGRVRKNCDSRLISRFISETIQDRAIVTMEYKQELIYYRSNGAISNDREWPPTQTSRSRQYSMLNMSVMVQDRHIFRPTMEN